MAFYKKVEVYPNDNPAKSFEALQNELPEDSWFAYFEYGPKGLEALFEGRLNERYTGYKPCVFYCNQEQALLSAGKLIPGQGYVLAFGYDKLGVCELSQKGLFHRSILYAFSAFEYKHNLMYPDEKKEIKIVENKQFLKPVMDVKQSDSDSSLEP